MTELLDQLKAARRALVLRLAEELDPEQHMPSPGYVNMLAGLQTAIAEVEAVLAEGQEADEMPPPNP